MVPVAVAGALVLGTALLVEPIAEGAWLSVIAADRLHWRSLLLPMLALAGLVLYTLVSFLTPARPFGVRGRAVLWIDDRGAIRHWRQTATECERRWARSHPQLREVA